MFLATIFHKFKTFQMQTILSLSENLKTEVLKEYHIHYLTFSQ